MASRLGLGRIIEWGRNTDPEELAYVLVRLTAIAKERGRRMDAADARGTTKRTKRAATPKPSVVHTDEAEHLDAHSTPERGISA